MRLRDNTHRQRYTFRSLDRAVSPQPTSAGWLWPSGGSRVVWEHLNPHAFRPNSPRTMVGFQRGLGSRRSVPRCVRRSRCCGTPALIEPDAAVGHSDSTQRTDILACQNDVRTESGFHRRVKTRTRAARPTGQAPYDAMLKERSQSWPSPAALVRRLTAAGSGSPRVQTSFRLHDLGSKQRRASCCGRTHNESHYRIRRSPASAKAPSHISILFDRFEDFRGDLTPVVAD